MTIAATYKLMEPYCLKKKKRCPGRGANLGSFWFSFIFSHKQRLRPLGYCAALWSLTVCLGFRSYKFCPLQVLIAKVSSAIKVTKMLWLILLQFCVYKLIALMITLEAASTFDPEWLRCPLGWQLSPFRRRVCNRQPTHFLWSRNWLR